MGLFNALFGKKSESIDISQEVERYQQLIRFVSFVKKIKPLTGGNYGGIRILYEVPQKNERLSTVYATFKFYDFDEIRFAREDALNSSTETHAQMVKFYYKRINERAGLSRYDWPFGIDAVDFAEVLLGTYGESYFTLIPDKYRDDIFTFKVSGGIDSRNAIQVTDAVINVLKSHFPELQIAKNHVTPYSMDITIQI